MRILLSRILNSSTAHVHKISFCLNTNPAPSERLRRITGCVAPANGSRIRSPGSVPRARLRPPRHEMFLGIEPEQACVHVEALPPKQNVQAPVAVASALMRQSPQSAAAVLHHGGDGNDTAPSCSHTPNDSRRPLAQVERRTQVSDSLSLGSARHPSSQPTSCCSYPRN